MIDLDPGALGAALAPVQPAVGLALAEAVERARSYASSARASNTRRVYDTQWRGFLSWCLAQGVSPLPASGAVVASYLAALADRGRKSAGIALALTAISQAHQLAGEVSPRSDAAVKETWKGIRRMLGTRQTGKAPLYGVPLLTALRALPDTRTGTRDRAILLLGFAGAFRRSELVALEVTDLRRVSEGLEVTLGRSKTDQEGQGRTIPIPREPVPEACPVRAVEAWLAAAGISSGPLFRGINRWGHLSGRGLRDHHVVRVVKAAALAAGLDPRAYGGHSLRAGLVTAAARAGRSTKSIQKTTGHTSEAMVGRYIRAAGLFDDAAPTGLLSHAAIR